MNYFKTFFVKIKKPEKEDEDLKDWDIDKSYRVIALDNQSVMAEVEEKTKDLHELLEEQKATIPGAEDDDDEVTEQLLPEDQETAGMEAANILWVLLGNLKTGEVRWFDIHDVLYAEE